jgi:uncharacterized protein YjbI with pentapeptide repeats
LLGSSETSARTGTIYALHELALEEEKYRQQIAQILCSHVRSKTSETEYQKTHKERPSNEIQTTLNLLFKEHKRGLYAQDFAKVTEFPRADLSHAYLVGASFEHAQCQGVNFWHAQCQGADFSLAQCQGADFCFAQCQGASFRGAQCQGADFGHAQCQGVNFSRVRCQGVNFKSTQCQGAYALKKFYSQELSSRIGEETKFEVLQLEGEIAENVIKNIENAEKYLSESRYEDLQTIIQDNKSKEPKYGTPKDCTTGILEDSKELQAIIKKDWGKLEQLNKATT